MTRKYVISIVGTDFLITFNGRTFPLDWPKDDRITIKELSDILHDPWTSIDVVSTDYGCDGCDGYDYSACEMSRCKHDCERCGGRKYICNDSCFFHRYKKAIKIGTNNSIIEMDLKPVHDKMNEYLAPSPNDSDSLFENIQSKFKEFEYRLNMFESHELGITFDCIRGKYAKCSLLHSFRNKIKSFDCNDLIEIQAENNIFRTLRKDVKIIRKGFLFWTSYHLMPTGEYIYDAVSDQLTAFDYEISFDTIESRNRFVTEVQNCEIGKVVISRQENGKNMVVNKRIE